MLGIGTELTGHGMVSELTAHGVGTELAVYGIGRHGIDRHGNS